MKTRVPYKWPPSLDLVKDTWDANEDQRILAFYSGYFDKLGPNLEQKLLGAIGRSGISKSRSFKYLIHAIIGYFTIDPENMKALLSTHFQGLSFPRNLSAKRQVPSS